MSCLAESSGARQATQSAGFGLPQRALVAAALLLLAHVQALPLPLSASDWFHEVLFPDPGDGSIEDEIACYSLPYGGLGFLSHILTYYTCVCLIAKKRPLMPCKELKGGKRNIATCTLGMVLTVATSALTMAACKNSWQFVLIAFWKLTLSFSSTGIGLSMSVAMASLGAKVRGTAETSTEGSSTTTAAEHGWPPLLIIFYWIGSFIGSIGFFAIVSETYSSFESIRIAMYVLIALGGTFLVGFAIYVLKKGKRRLYCLSPFICYGALLLILVFISDWVLAAIEGDWVGVPSGDQQVLFWLYWVGKRLPMLCY